MGWRGLTAAGLATIALAGGPAAAQQPDQRVEAKLDAGDGVAAELVDRVIITGMIPIPDVGPGAPRYSAADVEVIETIMRKAQTDSERDFRRCGGTIIGVCNDTMSDGGLISLTCEAEYARRTANLADKAREATQAAEEARRAVSAGTGDMAAAEAAELKRQQAVNDMEMARDRHARYAADIATYQKLSWSGTRKVDRLDLFAAELRRDRSGTGIFAGDADRPAGLSIENVRAEERKDSKGSYTVVFGDIRNEGDRRANVPNLSGALIDERGWVLHKTSVEPDKRKTIQPGKTYPFGFAVRPAADAAAQAVVSFASKTAPPPRMRMNAFYCSRRPW